MGTETSRCQRSRLLWRTSGKCNQGPTRFLVGGRDIETSLRFTQPTSKDLEETRRKDTNPTTSHTIGWQDHRDHYLGLSTCSSRRLSTIWYYNQWSMLCITPLRLRSSIRETLTAWCTTASWQRTRVQVQHRTGFTELTHPAYPPEIASNDYHLFSYLKNSLRCRNFEGINDRESLFEECRF